MLFIVKLSHSDDEYFPVIAERVEAPKDLNWKTEIKFDDGVQGFATIDRRYINLQNGGSIEESYKAVRGQKPTLAERINQPEINIYAYKQIITGCSVGGKFEFVDIEDGKKKFFSTFWNVSLNLSSKEQLIKEIALTKSGKLTAEECNAVLRERGALRGILEKAILEELKVVPFSEISSRYSIVAERVKKLFREGGGVESTGFDIAEFTVGNMRISN